LLGTTSQYSLDNRRRTAEQTQTTADFQQQDIRRHHTDRRRKATSPTGQTFQRLYFSELISFKHHQPWLQAKRRRQLLPGADASKPCRQIADQYPPTTDHGARRLA